MSKLRKILAEINGNDDIELIEVGDTLTASHRYFDMGFGLCNLEYIEIDGGHAINGRTGELDRELFNIGIEIGVIPKDFEENDCQDFTIPAGAKLVNKKSLSIEDAIWYEFEIKGHVVGFAERFDFNNLDPGQTYFEFQ